MKHGPIIYNLFPRLVGSMKSWIPHMERARAMGFDTVYVNPFHYPGFSGSLYAPKDFFAYNPVFLGTDRRSGHDQLADVLANAKRLGLRFMMDLVINHTAFDCPLVQDHPEWYKLDENGKVKNPSAIDPADARKVTVWGDLAEIDNEESKDKAALWAYWGQLVSYYQKMGVDDFRCDAAYKVPAELWKDIISAARALNPGARFFAETLGCRLEEARPLADAGFDYLFNSSKWWNLGEPWCLEQYEEFRKVAPSVAFPESHDTPRLAEELEGNEAALRMKYSLAALFSAGVMTVLGYEWGWKKKLDVVHTQPFDQEKHHLDLSAHITEVNQIKHSYPIFNVDAPNLLVSGADAPVFVMKKSFDAERVLLIINKNLKEETPFNFPDWDKWIEFTPAKGRNAKNPVRDISPGTKLQAVPLPLDLRLAPAQVVVLHYKKS